MDIQTILNITLSIITVWLAYRNFVLSNKKDTMRESEEMTEIKVKLGQAMDMLRDLQKEMRSVSIISERVVVMETKIEGIIDRIEKLEEKYGKQ